MKQAYNFLRLMLLIIALPLTLFAGSTGKISGRVIDSRTKEGIPGVNVRLESLPLGATTNVDGNYVILNVPPGRVNLLASFIGYKKYEVKDLRISVDFTTTLNISLEEGDIELDAVVVQAERSPLIRKDLTNPVASVSAEAIKELPVTSLDQIVGLQAGTTVDDDGSIHIRGGYGNEIGYTLNGMNINNPYSNSRSVGLATNAVQEVSISSGTFNAEYGNALSGIVNYVTKDGGSRFSMNVKYYTGDNFSNRKDPFFNIDKINLGNVNRTEATLGGPIIEDVLSFYGSGVYNWNGGYLYGIDLYRPEDSYATGDKFPNGDPRRGSSSDPFYFGPLLNSPTSPGLPSGSGVVVPLNWSRSYNLQGNLSLRIGAEMKLKYEIVYDNDLRPRNSGSSLILNSRYKPLGRNLNNEKGLFNSIEWTHSPASNFFYTIKGSYITNDFTSQAYNSPDDPRYLPDFYQQQIPGTSFLTGGVDLFRQKRRTKTISTKIDAQAQLWDVHELKLGSEIRIHRVENTQYNVTFRDGADSSADISEALAGSHFSPYIDYAPGGGSDYVSYLFKPVQLAAYAQDKIELFKSIILNLGLRYEYFNPASTYNPSLSQEFGDPANSNFFGAGAVRASKKHMLSPRVSVSYPITDQGTIRFSYGHFYQLGNLSSLYTNPYFYANKSAGTATFGNPNVLPQRSIQYELGLQQALNDNLKIEITGYYKDVNDYIYSQRILAGQYGDVAYNLLTNLNYANTRGVSISLLKRKTPDDVLSATIDYTFQVADGNRTEPTDDVFYSEQRGQLSETYLVPFSFDRSHTITSTVTLSEPNDWNVSAISYVRTGTPYTPSFPSNVVPITFVQNSDRQTVQWNVDLKAEKFFNFGDYTFSLFVQVDNVFDTQNETSVYVNSGRALVNIETTTNPSRFLEIRNRISRGDPGLVPISAIDGYFANPANLNQPRLIRFGASFNF